LGMQLPYYMAQQDCTKASIYNMPKKQGQTIDSIALKASTGAQIGRPPVPDHCPFILFFIFLASFSISSLL
jgi:hypothetical protein